LVYSERSMTSPVARASDLSEEHDSSLSNVKNDGRVEKSYTMVGVGCLC
jgi:hypothetical protein